MQIPASISSYLEKPRKRLIRKYHHFGTWRRLAEVLSDQAGFLINVRYPWEFAIRGIVPHNKQIQRVLGIPNHHVFTMAEVNAHLAHDTIQDMPMLILAWSLKNREPMI
jgi:hypothetical protein